MEAKIAVTKHPGKTRSLADEFIPLLGICSLNSMKCVYVKFSPSKQQSFFRKVSLKFVFHRTRAIFIQLSQCVSRRIVVVNAYKKSRVRFRAEPVSLLLFSSFLSFPLRLVFFLVIVVLFCFSIQLEIFKLINFLPYCRISLSTCCRSPVVLRTAIHVFLVIK